MKNWLNYQLKNEEDVSMNQSENYLKCPINSRIANTLMTSISNEKLRKNIWLNTNLEPKNNENILIELILKRQILAKTLNYNNYTEKNLENHILANKETNKMNENNNENKVMKFIDNIYNENSLKISNDYKILYDFKQKLNLTSTSNENIMNETTKEVQIWDLNYLIWNYRAMNTQNTHTKPALELIKQYFSLNECLNGIEMICYELFHIKLHKSDKISLNELWINHSNNSNEFIDSKILLQKYGIIKYEILNDFNELIGIIYLDLYNRTNKFIGSGHFTIQCQCNPNYSLITDFLSLNLANQSMNHSKTQSKTHFNEKIHNNSEKQLPIVALSLNLNNNNENENELPELSLNDLETLYHEFGHGLHSILSNTSFQHLSGTRCPTDFAEVSLQ